MGASNFYGMKFGMPLIVGRDFDMMKESFERDFDEPFTDDMYYAQQEYDFEDAQELAEDYSRELKFHVVTVRAGYYEGFQFEVKELHEDMFDLDTSSAYCLDNDDAHYYFDMCRSAAIRKADAEKRRIEKWLLNLARSENFIGLNCHGHASNGEGCYSIMTFA